MARRDVVVMLGVFVAFGAAALAQPPPQFKDKKGPARFEMGKVLPPFVRDALELTDEQKKQINDLESEVRIRLSQILTKDQMLRIRDAADKGPKGPPEKKPFGDDDGPSPPKKRAALEPIEKMPAEVATENMVRNPVLEPIRRTPKE